MSFKPASSGWPDISRSNREFVKRTIFFVITAAVFASLTACSTTVSNVDGGPYAPKGTNRKGTVAYNPYGIKEISDGRRQDALKRIYDICGSNNYKITKDEIRDKDKSMQDSLSTFGTSKLQFIDFECL
jgi:hypothetical protein